MKYQKINYTVNCYSCPAMGEMTPTSSHDTRKVIQKLTEGQG